VHLTKKSAFLFVAIVAVSGLFSGCANMKSVPFDAKRYEGETRPVNELAVVRMQYGTWESGFIEVVEWNGKPLLEKYKGYFNINYIQIKPGNHRFLLKYVRGNPMQMQRIAVGEISGEFEAGHSYLFDIRESADIKTGFFQSTDKTVQFFILDKGMDYNLECFSRAFYEYGRYGLRPGC